MDVRIHADWSAGEGELCFGFLGVEIIDIIVMVL